ncbi:hypothetical protein BDV40DRAFT_262349 [Aspergillus tamarii]|uniref:Uncharacterized protein n=1 Tax=Aspergillus tamarii TaxID=41984 RepID=A0A5N6UYK8_ASPTM|nr:hypothetical protein BDV40DRAFT_262349 [Aspergillus tamarii]
MLGPRNRCGLVSSIIAILFNSQHLIFSLIHPSIHRQNEGRYHHLSSRSCRTRHCCSGSQCSSCRKCRPRRSPFWGEQWREYSY